MKSDIVNYRELYGAIDTLRKENNERFDRIEAIFNSFHKEEFLPLERRVEKMWTYGTLATASISFIAAGVWQWFRERIKL